jgi:hypothetical protein
MAAEGIIKGGSGEANAIDHAIELKLPERVGGVIHHEAWCSCRSWHADGSLESVFAEWDRHLADNGLTSPPEAQPPANRMTPLWREIARMLARIESDLETAGQGELARERTHESTTIDK